jgi:hypothetical protein
MLHRFSKAGVVDHVGRILRGDGLYLATTSRYRDLIVRTLTFWSKQASKKEHEKNWQTFGPVTSCLGTGEGGPQGNIVVR